MDCSSILQKALEMFVQDYKAEIGRNGILPPSVNKSPLWPLWSVVEYAAMERDTTKYFLYYSAVRLALCDLASSNPLIIMVLGPGRGRLVDYVLDCLAEINTFGIVHVIEANEACCEMLKEKYCDVTNVVVHSSMIIRDYDETMLMLEQQNQSELFKIVQQKSINVLISELFGSFGDNEFMPEILEAAVKLFGSPDCVSIPKSFSSFLAPVFSPQLEKYFDEIRHKNESCESLYILGLPEDTVWLSQSQALYHATCTNGTSNLEGEITFSLQRDLTWDKSSQRDQLNGFKEEGRHFVDHCASSEELNPLVPLQTEHSVTDARLRDAMGEQTEKSTKLFGGCTSYEKTVMKSSETITHGIIAPRAELTPSTFRVTGFAGHFTAVLYKDIHIDTRPGKCRNTYFWETAFFPLNFDTKMAISNMCSNSGKHGHCKALTVRLKRMVKCVENNLTVCGGGAKACPDPQVPLFRLHYEWAVMSVNRTLLGNVHNDSGEWHSLHL